jgi:hypothetical protein
MENFANNLSKKIAKKITNPISKDIQKEAQTQGQTDSQIDNQAVPASKTLDSNIESDTQSSELSADKKDDSKSSQLRNKLRNLALAGATALSLGACGDLGVPSYNPSPKTQESAKEEPVKVQPQSPNDNVNQNPVSQNQVPNQNGGQNQPSEQPSTQQDTPPQTPAPEALKPLQINPIESAVDIAKMNQDIELKTYLEQSSVIVIVNSQSPNLFPTFYRIFTPPSSSQELEKILRNLKLDGNGFPVCNDENKRPITSFNVAPDFISDSFSKGVKNGAIKTDAGISSGFLPQGVRPLTIVSF